MIDPVFEALGMREVDPRPHPSGVEWPPVAPVQMPQLNLLRGLSPGLGAPAPASPRSSGDFGASPALPWGRAPPMPSALSWQAQLQASAAAMSAAPWLHAGFGYPSPLPQNARCGRANPWEAEAVQTPEAPKPHSAFRPGAPAFVPCPPGLGDTTRRADNELSASQLQSSPAPATPPSKLRSIEGACLEGTPVKVVLNWSSSPCEKEVLPRCSSPPPGLQDPRAASPPPGLEKPLAFNDTCKFGDVASNASTCATSPQAAEAPDPAAGAFLLGLLRGEDQASDDDTENTVRRSPQESAAAESGGRRPARRGRRAGRGRPSSKYQ
eukprot:gnl/TRDRNA2_/TRDRNA2_43503_c0_seq2.p1 gnl/TRDRNA2_/TRDRNA2_43503_c0~~gnl/TRDRNA2_/TRDRNA2_43503_c0_seq2.p1  ORF type:complete len:324 (+),score=49.67 gnl/TRDRNA2_/TRDRNA2_43503_c0_seq2:85-1056(+)